MSHVLFYLGVTSTLLFHGYRLLQASQMALVVKNSPAIRDIRGTGSIPGLGRSPGGRHGNPLQYSCLENPHRQRILAIYNPWSHEESDMTV